jgi:hypothetical protein
MPLQETDIERLTEALFRAVHSGGSSFFASVSVFNHCIDAKLLIHRLRLRGPQ